MKINFVDWVRDEMRNRNWTQSELARQSAMTPTAISDVLSGRRKPGRVFCEGVARAFGLPVDDVFRNAGLLPPSSTKDKLTNELLYNLEQLDEGERQSIAIQIRALADAKTKVKKRGNQGAKGAEV